MSYKAVFFDMDGTLMDSKTHTVPLSAIRSIEKLQQNGIKVFLATGRHSSVFPVFPQIHAIPFDGFITSNGQHCYNATETLHRKTIPLEDKTALFEVLKKHTIPIMYLGEKVITLNLYNERVARLDRDIGKVDYQLFEPSESLNQDIFALLLCGGLVEQELVMSAMPNCVSTRWIDSFADIFPKGGGKALGIQGVLNHYGIERHETIAFGDADNDIDMIEFVETGVAMGNAKDGLKALADYVAESVMDDGVEKALIHFGLI